MAQLRELKGLGIKSESQLNQIGIYSKEELETLGAVRAFFQLQQGGFKPSLNFLYAMVGALEDRHWTDISQSEKAQLLIQLEGYQELQQLL